MENIDFELYRVFCTVAKYNNITRAANELFISQPAVTQNIKKLEEQLERKLFYRTKQGMELTSDGETLNDNVKLAVACLSQAKINLGKLNEKLTIRIGCGNTFAKTTLLKPIKNFRTLFNNVTIQMSHQSSIELIKLLENNLIDIAILYINQAGDNYTIERIENEQYILVGNYTEFSRYKNKKVSLNDLNNIPLVLQQKQSTTRKFLDEICTRNHINLKAAYELESYNLVLDFVIQGLGLGFINKEYIKDELNSGLLFEIGTDFNIPPRNVYMAINKKILDNEMIEVLVKLLKQK